MSCGAAVIGSNMTSIPEVIGYEQALFDPCSVESITSKMQKALSSQDFLDDLKRKAHEQKKNFSWEQSSQKALDALLSLKKKKHQQQNRFLKIHLFNLSMTYLMH